MSSQEDADDLTFSDFLSKLEALAKGEWITAYVHRGGIEDPAFYSGLIPEDRVAASLQNASWDLTIGNGAPGFTFRWEGGREIATYHRHSEACEPLVIWREFHGIRKGYWEVLEEFRLYFNLFEDKRNQKLILINDNGDEEDAVLVSDEQIKVKGRLIKEFIAAKKMRLAIFFDFHRFSRKTLDELGIQKYQEVRRGDDFVISIGAGSAEGLFLEAQSQGFLLGKKLVSGLPDFKPRLFRREDRKFADFVIGVDEHGKEILHTCDEDKLANFFGKNPGAPQYVRPVFFKKDVLTKYYSQPEKYSVEDGYLRCGGLWGLRMDNNHPGSVMVFLGDLGHLSYSEQLHWRSFNIASGKMSRTAFARNIQGEFADPETADLFFKQRFTAFQKKWEEKFGWKLFKPLAEGDAYHLKTLRIPLTNEQREFDEQVLTLTKIFIDSLNEEELEKGLLLTKDNPKGLDKFEAFLSNRGVKFEGMHKFMRKLQALRSAAAAHRKGKNYEKVKEFFGIGTKELQFVFEDILIKCVWTLNSLEKHFLQADAGQ